MDSIVLLQLLLAHVLTDFVLQPTKWVVHKRTHKAASIYFYIHVVLSGALSVLFLQRIELWYIGVVITITHFVIDWWKLEQEEDNLKFFLLDQLFHILVIFICWLFIIDGFETVLEALIAVFSKSDILAIGIGYITVIFPVGFLIGKATAKWQTEIKEATHFPSLKKAGRYIGVFERILVLTFILSDNFSAIGLLIAAKSILRFGDKGEGNARKQTEYVLIGTLMSFAITILIGMLIRQFAF